MVPHMVLDDVTKLRMAVVQDGRAQGTGGFYKAEENHECGKAL